MKEPSRPANVPADAFWNAKEQEWQRGAYSKKKKPFPIGRWEYWRPDGSLCCIAHMDDEGLMHGMLERFHEDGTLASSGPYKEGHRGGRFIYIQSKNPSSEHYPANKKTWRHEFDSNRNWEEHNLRWFLEDGSECTSDGRPIDEAYDLDTVILSADPDNFLNDYAVKVKEAIKTSGSAGGPPASKNEEDDDDDYDKEEDADIDLSQVSEIWGIDTSKVKFFMENLHETDSFEICRSQRTFEPEDNIWYKLIAYPWDNTYEELAAVFLGAIHIGQLGDSDGVYTSLFRTQMKNPEPDYVYYWSHETYYIDEVLSRTQDDFAYRTAVSKANELERLSPAATRKAWKKLNGRTYAWWGAMSGLELLTDGEEDASDDEDLDDDESDAGEGGFKVDLDEKHSRRFSYWRTQWIQYLLIEDKRRRMDDVREVFRPGFNKPLSDEEHKNLVETGMRLPNNSCYYLWRYFWFKQEDRFQDCCRIFRDHPARIVRDLVKFFDDVFAGKTKIGNAIEDILALREEFLKLDLCPENERARAVKEEAKVEADTSLQNSTRELAEQEFNKGVDALMDLAWTQANNPLCIDEIENFARKFPGNDLYWKAFDWACNRGWERADQSQEEELAGVGIWLGKEGKNASIIQPFIWARLFKQDYPVASYLLRGIGCSTAALDSRLEKLLLKQLDEVEEYNHKRELAVHLLGCMQSELAAPRLNALIEEFLAAMSKFDRSEVRMETFAWEEMLRETGRTLGRLRAPEPAQRTAISKNLRKLYKFAIKTYQFALAGILLQTLCKWGETDLKSLAMSLRMGNDDPERWALLRTIESIADKLSEQELAELAEYFPNPDDDDNAVTVLYQRTLHALSNADKKGKGNRFKTQPIKEVLKDAEELSNYGNSWKEYRKVICETVGKFSELDLKIIERYLYSSERQVRQAAEDAYSKRGVKVPQRRELSWADAWKIAEANDTTEKAAEEIGKLIADPASVDRAALAGWLWQNPCEPAARHLAALVRSELSNYTPPGHGENLSQETTWILRALSRHAEYPEAQATIEEVFKHGDSELTGAIVQDVDALPVSFAPVLLEIATNDDGWRRYYISKWAMKNKSDTQVQAAIKSTKLSEKKLATWSK